MRILLALDKFKGSLTTRQASDAVTRGLKRDWPEVEIEVCPIADGGEGFTEAVLMALGGRWCETPAHDACGRVIQARYGMIQQHGKTEAIMEMSVVSGLAMVSDLPLDPFSASTLGTGEMMLHAIENGAQRIIIGIGGSATNDGGSGMASVMGYDFFDAHGKRVSVLPAEIERVERIVRSRPFSCEVVVACDVTNPLLGEHGSTRVYGPQKGVRDIDFFEARLARLAEITQRDLGCDYRYEPGAGAAGGLGFGLMSFCGAHLQSGFDLVADITGLFQRIQQADLIITGEGKLDAQTLHGKGPMGVAAMARKAGKPVIGIGGMIETSDDLISRFDGLLQIKPDDMAIPEAIARAAELLEETVGQQIDWFKKKASKH